MKWRQQKLPLTKIFLETKGPHTHSTCEDAS
jgi:hypothetical protein